MDREMMVQETIEKYEKFLNPAVAKVISIYGAGND